MFGFCLYFFADRDSLDDDLPVVRTTLPLPEVSIQPLPLVIETDIPAFGVVRSPLLITFTISNQTGIVQTIEASVQASEAFMFSGHKQVRMGHPLYMCSGSFN